MKLNSLPAFIPHFLRRFLHHFLHVALCLLGVGVVLAACSGTRNLAEKPATPPGPTTADYVLGAGQTVAIAPSVSIKLDRVNDSRCKTGAVCVWAGYLSYSFRLDNQHGSSTFVLSDSMPGAGKSVTVQRLRFTLVSVQPDTPPTPDQPAPNYRVTVKVAIT